MTAIDTRLVHHPRVPGEPAAATSTPVYLSATFVQDVDGGGGRWDYARSGNPTRDVLEAQLAALEGAARALAYSSGMAALGAVLRLVPAGGRVVVGDDLYGGTSRLVAAYAGQRALQVVCIDPTDPRQWCEVGAGTDLVLVESPSNPRLRAVDLSRLAAHVRDAGSRLVVDNSMLSPLLQRPLDLGAHVAVQSATKLLGGHGDLTAGVVATSEPDLVERLAFQQNAEGSALAPFDCWLLLRGLQTLPLRLERQVANARRIARLLVGHPVVARAYVPPGLLDGEGPAGPVLAFETGCVEASRRIVSSTRLFRTTVSFGSVASSISLPCSMSHAAVPAGARAVRGLRDDLVRLSVGIEDAGDLLADLGEALESAVGTAGAREAAVQSSGCAVRPPEGPCYGRASRPGHRPPGGRT